MPYDDRKKRTADHAFKSRYRADPRSEEQRKRDGTPRRPSPQRNREYYCACGVSFGNATHGDATRMWRDHKRSVGA